MILFKAALLVVRVWCIFFCFISLGYMTDVYLLESPPVVSLSVEYFFRLFILGVPLSAILIYFLWLVRYSFET